MWPNHMAFLHFVKRDVHRDDVPDEALWAKQKLRWVHPKSDAALFRRYCACYFAEIYSIHRAPDGFGNLRRMLARVGFYVRFMNVALQRKDYCVPIFYVTKDWKGMCKLMFEHTDGKVR